MEEPDPMAAKRATPGALQDVLGLYGSARSRREVFDITWAAVRTRMECETMLVSCYDPADGLVRCLYVNATRPAVDPSMFPPRPLDPEGEGTQSLVIRTGEPRLFEDFRAQFATSRNRFVGDYVGQVKEVGPAPAPEDAQVPPSAIMAPFALGHSRTGVLQVFSTNKEVYGPRDLAFVEAAAGAVSAAVRRLASTSG